MKKKMKKYYWRHAYVYGSRRGWLWIECKRQFWMRPMKEVWFCGWRRSQCGGWHGRRRSRREWRRCGREWWLKWIWRWWWIWNWIERKWRIGPGKENRKKWVDIQINASKKQESRHGMHRGGRMMWILQQRVDMWRIVRRGGIWSKELQLL